MELESIYEKLQIQDMNQMQKSTYKATENNQDIVLLSPTGSGKTLAFLFPVLRNLRKTVQGIQALILVPPENWLYRLSRFLKQWEQI
jgi:superfamily II DNA/RNA helicase